ncbi:hypothetical protein ACPTJM_20255 [Pseudomonas aeruginosa]|uniref:hypothetical protein n=1 Tax=Pseudomonas aeruginosa TaxID=287 RepID=UPI003CC65915
MRSMILIFAVALAGCAGRQDAEPRTVRVEVPVAVLCGAVLCRVPAAYRLRSAPAGSQQGL